jgi:hypothetical protein
VVPPSFGTQRAALCQVRRIPFLTQYVVSSSLIPSSLITVEFPAQSICFRVRCAAPRSIHPPRRCRLTPNPALCTTLLRLLVLFAAVSLFNCVRRLYHRSHGPVKGSTGFDLRSPRHDRAHATPRGGRSSVASTERHREVQAQAPRPAPPRPLRPGWPAASCPAHR